MKKTKLSLTLAALALAGFLSGCAMPPYNEELSLAQVTRSKLGTPVNTIGPIYAKLDPLLYFTSDTLLLIGSFPPEQRLAGWAFFDWGAFYFLNIRLGFRWQI